MFEKVNYFIHFNLAVALFLAYLLFVLGIQLARENEVRHGTRDGEERERTCNEPWEDTSSIIEA